MQAIRRRDTGPELAIRRLLHAAGYRYRCDYRVDVAGARIRPDIVFTRARVAIFVDGCFWHSCPEHGRTPRVNTDYWEPKLERNRTRDEANTRALEEAGWCVLRIWEHTIAHEALCLVRRAIPTPRPAIHASRDAVSEAAGKLC
ncbi:very short patch repair endonuclease [Microbacterium sp. JZ31]|uniref:very short patch repair endonuclease n=1 Tax=Microbacterium sp. JZ31 TaxID=1906274 RepID=UPI00193242BD